MVLDSCIFNEWLWLVIASNGNEALNHCIHHLVSSRLCTSWIRAFEMEKERSSSLSIAVCLPVPSPSSPSSWHTQLNLSWPLDPWALDVSPSSPSDMWGRHHDHTTRLLPPGAGAAEGSRPDPVRSSDRSTKAKSSIIMFSSLQGEGGLTTRQSGGRGRHTRGLAATSVSCEEAAPLTRQ